jgi:transposase-like protein
MAAERGKKNGWGKKKSPEPGADQAPCPEKAGNPGHAGEGQTPPPTDVDLPPGLNAKEAAAVEALLQQPTITRAAASVGIHERTLRRWMAEPAVHAALQEARHASFGQAIGMTQLYAAVAVSALIKIVQDANASSSARVAAAVAVLKFGREGIELDDLADRIQTVERKILPLLPDGSMPDVVDAEATEHEEPEEEER